MTDDRFDPEQLPAPVRRYLDARRARSSASLSSVFAPDARVVDEDAEHLGLAAVEEWFRASGSEYTYTTTYLRQTADAPDRWTVVAHLEGDFPGGEVDLHHRFRLAGDRIADLVIEP
ncbi:MAG: nuclear transport factor 2 family protein [Leifsonia sp.]